MEVRAQGLRDHGPAGVLEVGQLEELSEARHAVPRVHAQLGDSGQGR